MYLNIARLSVSMFINSAELKLIFMAFGQTNICLFCGCSVLYMYMYVKEVELQ